MVTGLAFAATGIATLFAEATMVRYTQRRTAHLAAWTITLAMFALAAGALALGTSSGWERATFRAFYLLGAVLTVPWLALGTLALLLGPIAARRARAVVLFFSGLATGVVVSAPMDNVHGTSIPVGKDVFGAFPRALAAIGSGAGALVIIGGALLSANRYTRDRRAPGAGGMLGANVLIALGTLILSSGGIVQGVVGHDEAFTLSLTVGIAVIYAGFLVAERARASPTSRRSSSPDAARGSSDTNSNLVGHL